MSIYPFQVAYMSDSIKKKTPSNKEKRKTVWKTDEMR